MAAASPSPSKAALRDAVLERWLHRITEPLEEIVRGKQAAPERLRLWLEELMMLKRRRALNEPELFATYISLAADARAVVKLHVDTLADQAARIIADGMKSGTITVKDSKVAARSVFDATARFHNPAHAAEWSDPAIDKAFEGVWSLLKAALTTRSASKRATKCRSRSSSQCSIGK